MLDLCVSDLFISDSLFIFVFLNNTSELHFLYVVPDKCGDREDLSQAPSKYDLPAVPTHPLYLNSLSLCLWFWN